MQLLLSRWQEQNCLKQRKKNTKKFVGLKILAIFATESMQKTTKESSILPYS